MAEILAVLVPYVPYLVGGLALWVAQRFNVAPVPGGTPSAPAPPVTPVVPRAPAVVPHTGNPVLDIFLGNLMQIVMAELEQKARELAVRVLPPPDPVKKNDDKPA